MILCKNVNFRVLPCSVLDGTVWFSSLSGYLESSGRQVPLEVCYFRRFCHNTTSPTDGRIWGSFLRSSLPEEIEPLPAEALFWCCSGCCVMCDFAKWGCTNCMTVILAEYRIMWWHDLLRLSHYGSLCRFPFEEIMDRFTTPRTV
jgi:hypothetical protein